jgi:glutamate racemase
LGCTYYLLLEETTKKLCLQWEIVNSAKLLAGKLKDLLPSDGKENKIHMFFTAKSPFWRK